MTQFLLPETYPFVKVLKGRSLHFSTFFFRHNTARIPLPHPTKTLVLRLFLTALSNAHCSLTCHFIYGLTPPCCVICVYLSSLFMMEYRFLFTSFLLTPTFSLTKLGRKTRAGCNHVYICANDDGQIRGRMKVGMRERQLVGRRQVSVSRTFHHLVHWYFMVKTPK